MENMMIIITAIFGGMAAYYISIELNKGAVFGSAVVTLVSGIFLPHFIPGIGSTLAVVATTASYAGMVAVKNVPNLKEMSVVGFIVGAVFILTTPAYAGVGGKLGTIAAISCFTWIGIKKVYMMVTVERSKDKVVENNLMDQI
ncbi:hypothetical protein Amet_4160 [Alkaliphilus metalliredigens QYMF]|uniref:Uncharacterized protein n=1 Tax=Alkaliphilus metalliredigens (strain QYMF) TaxID=293826 RepID=A6TVM3_ALKMQ|nr:hypothetical protein [Alkaliphilus metalliredigens]ABR50241.1 hypothetical protein Amet_4160 [Alkaliphilus metalliredigens QYMF]